MADIPANTSTSAVISVGGSVTDILEAVGDHDWIRVSLTAGQSYAIVLAGSGAAEVVDPYLRLRNAAGTLLAEDDDGAGARNSRIVFTPATSGSYFLDVGAWNEAFAGQYTLTVSAADTLPIYSMQQIADYLRDDFWDYINANPRSFAVNTISFNVTGLLPDAANLARAALALWSDVTGLVFTETTSSSARITFDDAGVSQAYSTSTISGSTIISSVVNISPNWAVGQGVGFNSYLFQTYLHEIGHALGLGHAGPYNGSATYPNNAAYVNDSWQATLMSYFHQDRNTYVDASFAFVLTPQLADILAVQEMYSAPATTRPGDTIYGFSSTAGRPVYDAALFITPVSYAIYDSGGIDTLNYSGYSQQQRINLTPGAYSNVGGGTGNVAIAFNTIIENAAGGLNADTIIGNFAANSLSGNGGADTLDGLGGDDTIDGGAASDTVILRGLLEDGFALIARNGAIHALDLTARAHDTITNVENFTDGWQTIASAAVPVFDPLAYAASYDELAIAFRTNANAAFSHFVTEGFFEGREIDFDVAQYLENWADLAAAFSSNPAGAILHFLNHGVDEHRLAEDPLDYIASYSDLIVTYGFQSKQVLKNAGLLDYAASGMVAGRRAGIDFDAEQYLANWGDLSAAFTGAEADDAAAVHFINHGYNEHRLWENPYLYVASYNDLVDAWEALSAVEIRGKALAHFANHGFNEGRRQYIDFDVEAYLAKYDDLRAAFADGNGGYDEEAAILYYIQSGFAQGQTDLLVA